MTEPLTAGLGLGAQIAKLGTAAVEAFAQPDSVKIDRQRTKNLQTARTLRADAADLTRRAQVLAAKREAVLEDRNRFDELAETRRTPLGRRAAGQRADRLELRAAKMAATIAELLTEAEACRAAANALHPVPAGSGT